MTGQALIVQGDALRLPLPDASVDLIVTSPPYFALRAYSAGPGEIGSEPTPQAFLAALWAATAEMARVLRPSGSIFVDLGDKYSQRPDQYAGSRRGHQGILAGTAADVATRFGATRSAEAPKFDSPPKSLMLLPERYRIGCVDRLGLIARAVIVWDKPNGLPESVTDRVRRSHEDWVHLTREPRYYSATDEIRENYSPVTLYDKRWKRATEMHNPHRNDGGTAAMDEPNPLGKLPGSVWTIPSEPLRLPEHLGVQHYAAFPSEWPRRLILGFSPPGICLDCGQGRVPVVDKGQLDESRPQARRAKQLADQAGLTDAHLDALVSQGTSDVGRAAATQTGTGRNTAEVQRLADEAKAVLGGYSREFLLARPSTILGYACSCTPHTDHPGSGGGDWGSYDDAGRSGGPAANGKRHVAENYKPKVGPWREYHLDRWTPPPTRPSVILDPFAGTGTTPMVARALGRIGVGVDLSHAYCRVARWRVRHDGAKAISRTNLERQTTLL